MTAYCDFGSRLWILFSTQNLQKNRKEKLRFSVKTKIVRACQNKISLFFCRRWGKKWFGAGTVGFISVACIVYIQIRGFAKNQVLAFTLFNNHEITVEFVKVQLAPIAMKACHHKSISQTYFLCSQCNLLKRLHCFCTFYQNSWN